MIRALKRWFGFADSDPVKADIMTGEIAVRSRSVFWTGFEALLPDPDPILTDMGVALETYNRLLNDAHVWACYESRTSGTQSHEWRIEPAAEGSTLANKKAADFIKTVMDGIDVGAVIADMLDAIFFGYSPIEVIWAQTPSIRAVPETTRTDGPSVWRPVNLIGRPPEYFAYDQNNRLRFISRDHQWDGELLPDRKFLVTRHHATYRNPYGQRVLSKCFWPVTFKRGGIKFWSICAEKFGMPWVLGKVPRGTNETERERILSSLVQMVQDAVAVINADQTVEFLDDSSRATSGEFYDRLVNAANNEISKAILGQTLTTEIGDKGSYAASQTHFAVRNDLIGSDKKMVAAAFNTLFRWITELNFATAQPPTFSWWEAEDVQKDWAGRDVVLVKALSPAGVTLSPEYFKRKYNLADIDLVAWPGGT